MVKLSVMKKLAKEKGLIVGTDAYAAICSKAEAMFGGAIKQALKDKAHIIRPKHFQKKK